MGYTIDKISSHTQQPREPEPYDVMAAQFWHAVKFLLENGLTRRHLAASIDDLDEGFGIHTDDLTSEGLALMKDAYEKWVRKVERGMTPDDTTLLEQTEEPAFSGPREEVGRQSVGNVTLPSEQFDRVEMPLRLVVDRHDAGGLPPCSVMKNAGSGVLSRVGPALLGAAFLLACGATSQTPAVHSSRSPVVEIVPAPRARGEGPARAHGAARRGWPEPDVAPPVEPSCDVQAAPTVTGPRHRVRIASNPSTARVLLDGRCLGRTPIVLHAPADASWVIRVRMAGFNDALSSIGERAGTVHLDLEREPEARGPSGPRNCGVTGCGEPMGGRE